MYSTLIIESEGERERAKEENSQQGDTQEYDGSGKRP